MRGDFGRLRDAECTCGAGANCASTEPEFECRADCSEAESAGGTGASRAANTDGANAANTGSADSAGKRVASAGADSGSDGGRTCSAGRHSSSGKFRAIGAIGESGGGDECNGRFH